MQTGENIAVIFGNRIGRGIQLYQQFVFIISEVPLCSLSLSPLLSHCSISLGGFFSHINKQKVIKISALTVFTFKGKETDYE